MKQIMIKYSNSDKLEIGLVKHINSSHIIQSIVPILEGRAFDGNIVIYGYIVIYNIKDNKDGKE